MVLEVTDKSSESFKFATFRENIITQDKGYCVKFFNI